MTKVIAVKSKSLQTIDLSVRSMIKKINKQPYISGEGEKTFDTDAIDNIKQTFLRHKDLDGFISSSSVKEKMEISAYLNTGKYDVLPDDLIKQFDDILKNSGEYVVFRLLEKFVGIDTRGMITMVFPIGKMVDIFAVEESMDKTFRAISNPDYMGYSMKMGQVFNLFTQYFGVKK